MKTSRYVIHLEPDEDGGFVVTVPELPGCITWGCDIAHATEMARECIEGFLEAMAKAGLTPPDKAALPALDLVIEVNVPNAA